MILTITVVVVVAGVFGFLGLLLGALITIGYVLMDREM